MLIGLSRLLIIFALCFLAAMPLSAPAMAQAEGKPLTLGVHPYLPATEIMEKFGPLAEYLSDRLGRKVVISISKDYDDHIKKAGNGKYDIAFMGPVSYLKMVKLYGERPILARFEINGKPVFQGVVFVSKASPIKSLAEMRAKRFAFGDPNSTMSHLVPRHMLYKAGLKVEDLSKHSFMSNHDNVILGVLVGDYDAGAVMMDVFKEHAARGLRAIAETPLISEHVFLAGGGIDAETIKALKQALYSLRGAPEGKKILGSIKKAVTGLVPASHSDYDNLSAILAELEKLGVKY